MAINNTQTAYAFGQLGSILVTDDSIVTSYEVLTDDASAGIKAVGTNARFVAITFLEDTVFNSDTNGLTAETKELFPDATGVGKSIDGNGGSVSNSQVFPKGITIYGRWKGFRLSSGSVIAYIGY